MAISLAGATAGFFLAGWLTIAAVQEETGLAGEPRKRWLSGFAWAVAFLAGFLVLYWMGLESQTLLRIWVAGAVTGAIGGAATSWLIRPSSEPRRGIHAALGGVIWSCALAVNFYVIVLFGYIFLSSGLASALPLRLLGWAVAGAIGGLVSSILGASQFVSRAVPGK